MNSAVPRRRRHRPRPAGSRGSRTGPSRRMRPLPTQFRATPPASTRFFMPVCRWTCRAVRSMTSSVTAWIEAARSISRCVSRLSGLPRRPAEEPVELPRGHRQPLAVVEVAHVHAVRAVFLEVDQVLEDQVLVDRLAVGGQAHDLVFAAVDAKAGIVGEGRVEQAQRMREADLVGQFDAVAAADAEAGGRPFAHAVDGEDRRLVEGRREEGAGGVRFVVIGEDVAAAILPPSVALRIDGGQVQLLFQPQRHGLAERAVAGRRPWPGRFPAAARTW